MLKKSKLSPYEIELISNNKQLVFVLILLIFLFLIRICFEYFNYSNLPFTKAGEIEARVLKQYEKTKINKKGKEEKYFVLKLESNNHIFYTTSKEKIKNLVNREVKIYGKATCSFYEYFKSCFFINFSLATKPSNNSIKEKLNNFIDSQHKNKLNANLFQTLFLGENLNSDWREVSNKLGLGHILAISGFHLGILSAFILLVITPIYRFFQQRFFTYRNELYDLGFITLICLAFYLVLLDFLPSFLRAFVMAAFGFYLYFSGLKILNFKLLFLIACICIVLFPSIIFNIGFILSMAGVFYIFLFIKYYKHKNLVLYWIMFNISIFFNIAPIVHFFFPYFSIYQLISIPVSLAFVVFFPIMLILHILGIGNILDPILNFILTIDIPSSEFSTSLYFFIFYCLISFAAIFHRFFYYFLYFLSICFYIAMLVESKIN